MSRCSPQGSPAGARHQSLGLNPQAPGASGGAGVAGGDGLLVGAGVLGDVVVGAGAVLTSVGAGAVLLPWEQPRSASSMMSCVG